jgi:hypothetical protein
VELAAQINEPGAGIAEFPQRVLWQGGDVQETSTGNIEHLVLAEVFPPGRHHGAPRLMDIGAKLQLV